MKKIGTLHNNFFEKMATQHDCAKIILMSSKYFCQKIVDYATSFINDTLDMSFMLGTSEA
jgi:hypothetical protein